jgi:DNA-binding response OmpR family regulator
MSRILLLEPDVQLGETYRQGLIFAGHEVDWCRDAQIAVDSLNQNMPDLIITELQLAMHNGVEFLYELRSYTDLQKLPVMVLSHVPQLERGVGKALWENIRISAYHYKPLTRLHDLIRSVESTLSNAPA